MPRPYVGAALPGIAYIHRAQDLPEPKGLPLAVGFDLETWNRRTDIWRHKASLFPFLGGEIRLAQISDGHQSLVIDVALIGAAAIDWLRVLARDPERTLVGHNLLFEATYLISIGIRPLCKWWDTMLASKTIGEHPDNTLAAVARNYLGEELDKAEQTGDWGNEITASQLRYAAADSLKALQARGPLAARLEETGQTEVHRADCLLISAAADGQHRGLGIDVARLDEMEAAASAACQAKRTTLDVEQPYRDTPTIHPILERTLKAPLKKWQKNSKTGEWGERDSCDKTVLEPFQGHPLVDRLLEVKGLDSTRQELTQLRRDAEFAGGRTRPNYKLLGANTGRTTTCGQIGKNDRGGFFSDTEVFKSGKNKGKPKPAVVPSQIGCNFQGLSKEAKRCLITGNPDTELLDVDWSQQELCLQASPKLYNDSGFRTIILEGVDPHAQIAGAVLGREVEPLSYDDDGKPVWPKERSSIGKPANFGLSYGCGVQSLEERIRVKRGAGYKEGDGQRAYAAWHRFHPQCSAQKARFQGANIDEVRSLLGRRIRHTSSPLKSDGTKAAFKLTPQQGVNWPIQSSGRDMLAIAVGDLWPALDRFPGVHIIGLIHDEILLETPRHLITEVKQVVMEVMTSERLREMFYGDIPLEASVKRGDSWGSTHD